MPLVLNISIRQNDKQLKTGRGGGERAGAQPLPAPRLADNPACSCQILASPTPWVIVGVDALEVNRKRSAHALGAFYRAINAAVSDLLVMLPPE